MPAPHTVVVGSFSGPFDLLLQLAARRQVDVHDVAIAEITDDYLAVLRTLDVVDLDETTQFLVVAATLVELKAARLLPVDDDSDLDELALEARDLLYARLLEYRTFKRASRWVAERLEATADLRSRTAGPGPEHAGVRPELAWTTSPADLHRLAVQLRAGRPAPRVDLSHVSPVRMTVAEAADLVLDELGRAGGAAAFAELTAGCRHRIEVVACFLAVLELYRHELVDLDQPTTLGRLRVTALEPARWRGESGAGLGVLTPETASG